MKLNHKERGIIIAALTEARSNWNKAASEIRGSADKAKASEAVRLAADAVAARDLCAKIEDEQS